MHEEQRDNDPIQQQIIAGDLIYGDRVAGDKVGSDKIAVGDVGGSCNAIGNSATRVATAVATMTFH